MRTFVLGVATVLALSAIVTAAPILDENFEDLDGWTQVNTTYQAAVSTEQYVSSSKSVKTTNSASRIYKGFTAQTGAVTSEWKIYDNGGARGWAEIQSRTGDVYSGGLNQIFAAGKYNNVSMTGEVYNGYKYQARVLYGNTGQTGWFNLNAAGSPNRSVGWHTFKVVATPDAVNTAKYSTVDFYVDGILSRTIVGANKYTAGMNFAVVGGGTGTTAETFYYDDFVVTPEPATLALLASGLLFIRRRNRA